MPWGVAAMAIGGIVAADMQGDAAEDAANTQAASADAGVREQRRQFNEIQALLKPYVTAGESALGGQQNLLGTNGAAQQQASIAALQQSPQFMAAMQTGENAILQNASATGGLRGGNTQAALGQFRPQLLAQTINDQYARLGGMSSMGLGAAGQTGQFAQSATNNVTNLLQQQGAAIAGGQLARGQANAGMVNSVASAFGGYAGYGGKF